MRNMWEQKPKKLYLTLTGEQKIKKGMDKSKNSVKIYISKYVKEIKCKWKFVENL